MVMEAFQLRRDGWDTQDIAELLGIAEQTVRSYFADPTGERAVRASARSERKRKGVTAREDAEKRMNRMDLPITSKITMRPVWKRRQRRIYGQNKTPPITEEEKLDAIKILGDEELQRLGPALYFDAFLILDEAGK
jgi:predicted transcriptional regulator